MIWRPAFGTLARFTAASVSFFPMVGSPRSDSLSTAFCTLIFAWRTTEQYGGICRKIKANRDDVRVLYGALWRRKEQVMPPLHECPQPEGSHGKLRRTTKILSHAARRRGGRVAARGARAAAGDA